MSGIASPGSLSPLTGLTVLGSPHVYYHSNPNLLMELKWTGSGWFPSEITTQEGAAPPWEKGFLASFTVLDDSPHIYYQSHATHIIELAWNGSNWIRSNLMARAGTAPALFNSPLVAFNVPPSLPRVYYLSRENHTMELKWTGSGWAAGDLTDQAGAAPAASGSPLAAFATPETYPHVYYLSPEFHVMELKWTGSGWTTSEITT